MESKMAYFFSFAFLGLRKRDGETKAESINQGRVVGCCAQKAEQTDAMRCDAMRSSGRTKGGGQEAVE